MKHGIARYGLFLTASLAFAAFIGAGGAVAQTATNLICNGCVGKKDIGNNAIVSKHIKDGKVKAKDLNKNAKPAAVASSIDFGAPIPVAGTPTALRTVTIDLPGPGAVIATANVLILAATSQVLCKIDTEATAISTGSDGLSGIRTTGSDFGTVSAHRVFPVTTDTFTAVFVCQNYGDAPVAYSPILSLVFVPGAQIITEESASEGDAALSSSSGLLGN
jgi:hypothetical protein